MIDNVLKFEIKVERKKIAAIIVSAFMVLLAIAVPVFVAMYHSEKIKHQFLLSIVVFAYVAFYFLKIILWNLYGKELYTIEENKFHLECDYKFFRMNKVEFEFDTLDFSALPASEITSEQKKVLLKIKSTDHDLFISVIPISRTEWRNKRDLIKKK